MKRLLLLFTALTLALPLFLQAQKHYDYISYSHDAMNVRIYTLDNGLKVFLSVYRDAPRIQTLIPVRVGSKNDPAETTGLAHYLEHLMFKGTRQFGTTDYEAEKPLLDEIERQFEVYRRTREKSDRDNIYRIIDSLSYIASGYAIPNEYDKMMKFIGSQGTNAATSNDYTVYIEDIPANQLENWAIIQADRFSNPVFRIFHTELETVYEEKNTSLANDGRKASEAMLNALFPNNPYGQQTTLGSVEHLKNPSLTNIRKFFDTYYVPNNMAVCLAGDFDYDEAIAIIDKYFGQLKAKEVPHYTIAKETPITTPIVREVTGHEAEFVNVAFRLDLPANHRDLFIVEMLDNILSNGRCGLMDLNINQKHLAARVSSYLYGLCDNSAYVLSGRPNAGQTLEEVRDLMLAQLELIKQGKFDESLMQAAINNIETSQMRQLQSNRSRANAMARAFENDIDWFHASQELEYYKKVTKEDIVKFANRYFKDNNYVVVFKRQGEPKETGKVTKPAITAIQVNRDAESEFFTKLKARPVKPIEPVFVDFQKAITFDHYKSVPINYLHNDEDQTFTLRMVFPAGEMNDLLLPYAARYISNLGTPDHTVEQLKTLFYTLACNYSISCSDDETYVTVSGLGHNMGEALRLMMEVVQNAQPDAKALQNLVDDVMLQRKNAKSSQNSVMNCLRTYCEFGPNLVKYQLNDEQLQKLKPEQLLTALRTLFSYKPEILYYGPATVKQLKKSLATSYKLPKSFGTPPPAKKFDRLPTDRNVVYYASYPAKQSRLITSNRVDKLNTEFLPIAKMYNQYFGGSMNAIVFQEMREKRSLAYSAQSSFVTPADSAAYMYNYSYVATQNDKIIDAMTAFDALFNEIPLSQSAFDLAKEGVRNNIVSNRITKMNILNTYLSNRKMGLNHDYREDIYNLLNGFTLGDIKEFNHKFIQNKPKTYMILATEGEVDLDAVGDIFGTVVKLTLEDIFGY